MARESASSPLLQVVTTQILPSRLAISQIPLPPSTLSHRSGRVIGIIGRLRNPRVSVSPRPSNAVEVVEYYAKHAYEQDADGYAQADADSGPEGEAGVRGIWGLRWD